MVKVKNVSSHVTVLTPLKHVIPPQEHVRSLAVEMDHQLDSAISGEDQDVGLVMWLLVNQQLKEECMQIS